ncbi:MAG TPA: glycosyltransferase family 4 protein [Thermoanaerobaculia bacterium]|nr:glycosyltransferase family 4 protein [Thermoanaerobaculia bacterium]
MLAARPVEGATHYQLHSGLHREAFAAERESFPSGLRRAFFRPALALNLRRRAILRAEDRLLRDPAVRVMVFSEALRGTLLGRIGLPAGRVTLDRPGVDRLLFRPAAPAPGDARLRLVFVGHNFALKGLATVIAAVALRPGTALVVIGGGRAAPYRRLAERLRVGDRVRFAGALDAEAVAERYRESDALVHPTFYDPYPLVAAEALASGLPVVTTRRSGASEILTPGSGFLIDDPRDARALAGALSRLADPEIREPMRDAALRAAAPLTAWDHFERVREWLGLARSA